MGDPSGKPTGYRHRRLSPAEWWAFGWFSMPTVPRDGGDGVSIAAGLQKCHGGLGQVAAIADLPLVVGVVENGSDESNYRAVV